MGNQLLRIAVGLQLPAGTERRKEGSQTGAPMLCPVSHKRAPRRFLQGGDPDPHLQMRQ